MNEENLAKLASYLDNLPNDYPHFDMREYVNIIPIKRSRGYARNNCNTVACAIGHGPAAGIPPLVIELLPHGIDWAAYATRAFLPVESDAYQFMFSDAWYFVDNTPQGAAARIRFILEGNVVDFTEFFEFLDDPTALLTRVRNFIDIGN